MRLIDNGCEMTLTLSSPITEEQFDAITDVDFDNTDRIWFHTKHGKDVEFVKRKKGWWIPCSERLPEPQTEVVVSFDNGEVKILWQNWADPSSLSNYPGEPLAYIGGDGIPHTYEDWESMKTYAVAWMPLPEPYREEGK